MQRMGHIHSTCPNMPTNLHREMQEKTRINGENDLLDDRRRSHLSK